MNTTITLLLLAFYFHLGWCWTGILAYLSDEPLSRKQWWLVLVIWPLSILVTDDYLGEKDDY